MSEEARGARRVSLTRLWVMAVMIASLQSSGGRIAGANRDYRVPSFPISGVSAAAPEDRRDADEWLFPGEYESHQAMWMLWPTYENKAGFPSADPMSDMIRAMSGHVHVNLAVQDADDEASARSLLTAKGVPLDHVHFFQIEHGDIWARDMGPQFTRGRSGKLRINDWNFSFWGYEEPDSELSAFDLLTAPSPPSSKSRRSTRAPGLLAAFVWCTRAEA
jgi:hypothetical protein